MQAPYYNFTNKKHVIGISIDLRSLDWDYGLFAHDNPIQYYRTTTLLNI